MGNAEPQAPRAGDLAPDFSLPAGRREGAVSSATTTVRWVSLESAREGLVGLDNFPTDEELLAVARRHTS